MKKNGFVFIETICVMVVLLTALLLLYSSFNKIITREQKYLYYDDISYIYKSEYIKRIMYDSINISDDGTSTTNYFHKYIDENTKKDVSGNKTNRLTFINRDTQVDGNNIFTDAGKTNIETLYNFYNVWQAIYIKTDDIDDVKSYNLTYTEKGNINNIINLYTVDKQKDFFKTYLKKLDVEDKDSHDGIIIFIFLESKNGVYGIKDKDKLTNYNSCVNSTVFSRYSYTQKSMTCEMTPYIAWVYYD